jgi:GNAT superfamily N-acetyltransferase
MRQWIDLFEQQVRITHFEPEESTRDYPVFEVFAVIDGKQVGRLTFDVGSNHVRGVEVDADYRRQGIATALYDYVENELGYHITPSKYLEPDGQKFWAARRLRESALSAVSQEDIISYYEENHPDLETLLDNDWTLTADYQRDIDRLKAELQPFAKQKHLTLYRAYRAIGVDRDALGIHWSIDPDTDFGTRLVTIEVAMEYVDWVGTIARGVHWWNDEKEITLHKGVPVQIISVKDLEGIDAPEPGGPGRT